ncbi:MAG: DUF1320 domain-containing protein [Deltaproteobacteria bacterium]|nr:DUF1320 domain-containing protein [Deltaproteobacteria bacterium]
MYSSETDLKRLLSPDTLRQLADDGLGGLPPEEVIAEAIEQADREIDAYLGLVMTVPLAATPPLAANLSAKIAAYNLHRRRSHLELGEWAEEYKRCLKLLEKIGSGELTLGPGPGNTTAEPASPGSLAVVTAKPLFDLETY